MALAACTDQQIVEPTVALKAAPVRLDVVAGQNQTGRPGAQLPNPLVVRVVDAAGAAVSGQLVNFRVTVGGGTVFAGAALTNGNGVAQEWWTLGPTVGPNALEVRAVNPETGERLTFATFQAEAQLEPAPVAAVTVQPEMASLMTGDTVVLTAIPRDSAGNPLTDRAVSWSSTDPSVASVASSGGTGAVARAVSPGRAEIIATAEGRSDTAAVTVQDTVRAPAHSLAVVPETASVSVGDTLSLMATLRDSAGNALTDRSVSWSSSNPEVATVTSSGGTAALARAVAAGVAEIVAWSEGKSDTTTVTVADTVRAVSAVTLRPEIAAVDIGDTLDLTAVPADAAGKPLSGREVSWSSTNPAVASVTASSGTNAIAIAESPGVAEIIATAEGKSDTATVMVADTVRATFAGIWIGSEEIAALPTSGGGWNNVKAAADKACGKPNLADQDESANTCVMAKALVYARLGETRYRNDVVVALWSIVNSGPYNGRALALGRKLGTYVIAADLISLATHYPAFDARFRAKLRELRTTFTKDGPRNLLECDSIRPNNWGTACGFTLTAIAAYGADRAELDQRARIFKGWVGDRSSYAGFEYKDLTWQCDPAAPVGINPAGCVRYGVNLDGVLADDQRRCGTFIWPPCKTDYYWGALQGAVAQALLLHRQGHPAFEWQERALLRAVVWIHTEGLYPAEGNDVWVVHLINHVYGSTFPAATPAIRGKNAGWTDWTHASGGNRLLGGFNPRG